MLRNHRLKEPEISHTPNDYDVLIAGAGITGGTLACALLHSDLTVGLLDAGTSQEDVLRVSAIAPGSCRVLSRIGAWQKLPAGSAHPYREMHVWDGDSTIHFTAAEHAQPCLGYVVENRALEQALSTRLAGARTVTRHEGRLVGLCVRDQSVEVNLADGRTLRGSILIGADGARSKVRQSAGIARRTRDYAQSAIIATVRTQRHHADTAWQRFLSTGPLAFLPLADGCCSIVWSCAEDHARVLLDLAPPDFAVALARAFGARLGEVVLEGPRAAFPLALAHNARYIAPRLALVGDAAHTVHPLAGQGANLGIADAATLAEVLGDATARGRDPGSRPVLRRYERWRRGENLLTLAAMDGIERLFGAQGTALRTLRGLGLRLVDATPWIKERFAQRAMGLEGDLPRLARV